MLFDYNKHTIKKDVSPEKNIFFPANRNNYTILKIL